MLIHIYLFVCLSRVNSLFVCLVFFSLSVSYLFIYVSMYLSPYQPILQFIYIYLSIYLSVWLSFSDS